MSEEEKLANFVKQHIPDFKHAIPYTQGHMGALIMDACMQAGLSYDNIVKPRVEEIAKDPSLRTTKGVAQNLDKMLAIAVNNGAKRECIRELTSLFLQNGIDTVSDLKKSYWHIRNSLTGVKNISWKTRDYIGILAGVSDIVAIDTLLTKFAVKAEINVGNPSSNEKDYDKLFNIYVKAAKLLSVTPAQLDYAVWRYMNGR